MPPDEWEPKWNREGKLRSEGGITVDGEVTCPAAPCPKCVAVGTCQGSCLGRVIDSDKHGLLYGHGDTLGLPIYNGEIVK